ncbi:MAG: lipopolysaccharide biosynthesis protein [Burkholderiales bacterium]|nr:lipopolysaccharide biosynthesis protein [Burkholderiales bacterium]
MASTSDPSAAEDARREPAQPDGSLIEFLTPLAKVWRRMLIVPMLAGAVSVGASFLVPKTYQATTRLLTQQQPSSAAASALASLGALGALSGLSLGGRSPAELYASLMLSDNATDRIIDRFELMRAYDVEQRWQARRELSNNTVIAIGKKDGLISVSVEDESPQRAAEIANHYVTELRRLTTELAITEAQQRRLFFERQLEQARDRLADAQAALQASGFTIEALKAEPKAAADSYAKLRAELTAAEVRLQALRSSFADAAPEVRTLQGTVAALRSQLSRSEASRDPAELGPDYVSKYREFKYRETLYELVGQQFELARVDESREGALVQVVDIARPPERKLRPKRSLYGIVAALGAFVLLAGWTIAGARIRQAEHSDPAAHARWQAFRRAFRRRTVT